MFILSALTVLGLVNRCYLSPPMQNTSYILSGHQTVNLRVIESCVHRWNDLYHTLNLDTKNQLPVGDLLQLFLTEPILYGDGSPKWLKSWELVLEIGTPQEWLQWDWISEKEYEQANHAVKILTKARTIIQSMEIKKPFVDHRVQGLLIEDEELKQLFASGQSLEKFAGENEEKDKSMRVSEWMRYYRRQELFLYLLSKRILRKTWWAKADPESLGPTPIPEALKLPEEYKNGLEQFRVFNYEQGMFFHPLGGFSKGHHKEIGYIGTQPLAEFLRQNSTLLVQLFLASLYTEIPLSDDIFDTIPQVTASLEGPLDKEAYSYFGEILERTSRSTVLVPMLTLGVLSVVKPAFKRIELLSVYGDSDFHWYTVDAHTIQQLKLLEEFDKANYATSREGFVNRWRSLLAVALCDVERNGVLIELIIDRLSHDEGKPYWLRNQQASDHDFYAAYGGLVPNFLKLFPDHFLRSQELVSALISNGDMLWHYLSSRDVEDSNSISQLAQIIMGKEKETPPGFLSALVVSSYLDRKTTQFKKDEELLSEGLDNILYAYFLLSKRMEDPDWSPQEEQKNLKESVTKRFKDANRYDPPIETGINSYFELMPFMTMFFRSMPEIVEEVELLADVIEQNSLKILLRPIGEKGSNLFDLLIFYKDIPGFLRNTCAGLLIDFDIRRAEINTTVEGLIADHMVVEVMDPQLAERLHDSYELKNFVDEKTYQIAQLIQKQISVKDFFEKHNREPKFQSRHSLYGLPEPQIKTEIIIKNVMHERREVTQVDVRSFDRIGFVFIVTDHMYRLGMNIVDAEFRTNGLEVYDTFYVVDEKGKPVRLIMQGILRRLLEHLLPMDPVQLSPEWLQDKGVSIKIEDRLTSAL